MLIGIGIDTGGTYTDAVAYDFEARAVVAKAKARTTREDLSVGIGAALDALPAELVQASRLLSLSTTLATNACVERKGGRAKLVLLGTSRKILEWIDAKNVYGLDAGDVLCLHTHSSFDGTVVDHPDWERVAGEEDAWFADAQALAVAEVNGSRNGGVCEALGQKFLQERYGVPVIMGTELSAGLNVMERGATALLNARLLPVIRDFMAAVEQAARSRGIEARQMIVRSDGSLMNTGTALKHPVTTILSGPAASVLGSKALAELTDCLVVDMGGTTTDVSVVRDGKPAMQAGIRIGGYRTQIRGVFIDTIGLGGDSRIVIRDGQLALENRRVEPLCVAARRWPELREQLEALLLNKDGGTMLLYEGLYLVREPERMEDYLPHEQALVAQLREGPVMLGGGRIDPYGLRCGRLEDEGIIMRCGMTPTDIMHIRGDFDSFDREASRLGARYLLRALRGYQDTEQDLQRLCGDVYDMVCGKLYENLVRILLQNQYPQLGKGLDGQLEMLIREGWEKRKEAPGFFRLGFQAQASLVGIGAPIHVFLPAVAEALGVPCILPEHGEVANAVGAVVSNITAVATAEITPSYDDNSSDLCIVRAKGVCRGFADREEALEFAGDIAGDQALAAARAQGATGEIFCTRRIISHAASSRDDVPVDLGTTVEVTAVSEFTAW